MGTVELGKVLVTQRKDLSCPGASVNRDHGGRRAQGSTEIQDHRNQVLFCISDATMTVKQSPQFSSAANLNKLGMIWGKGAGILDTFLCIASDWPGTCSEGQSLELKEVCLPLLRLWSSGIKVLPLAILNLALYTRLTSNSQRSACFCLLSAGIKGVYHHA